MLIFADERQQDIDPNMDMTAEGLGDDDHDVAETEEMEGLNTEHEGNPKVNNDDIDDMEGDSDGSHGTDSDVDDSSDSELDSDIGSYACF